MTEIPEIVSRSLGDLDIVDEYLLGNIPDEDYREFHNCLKSVAKNIKRLAKMAAKQNEEDMC